MTGEVVRRAPGKLFVAGEYAVLEPGHPAVLVAVDRYVTVTARPGARCAPGAEVVVASDLLEGEVALRWSGSHQYGVGTLAAVDPADQEAVDGVLAHVVSAVEVVEELAAERGLRASPLHVTTAGRLHERGTKVGLGSSGAVTVATVAAVAVCLGVRLSAQERLRLAMLASVRVDPGPSGADLAASTWGGWVLYRAPDRLAVRDAVGCDGVAAALRTSWPGFEVRPLPSPRSLALHVGWSGSPASTSSMVGHLRTLAWYGGPDHRRFLARSDERMASLVAALERNDGSAVLDDVRAVRRLLAETDRDACLGVFTDRLSALCEVAESVGGAAKPSGSGGGDCGLALLPASDGGSSASTARGPSKGVGRALETAARALRAGWTARGITVLDLREAPGLGATAGPAGNHAGGTDRVPASATSKDVAL